MPKFRKKKVNPFLTQRLWFNPRKLYKSGHQRFATLAVDACVFITKRLKKWFRFPERVKALEIGPGNFPVLQFMGFKKSFFLDVSEAFLRQCIWDLGRKNFEFVVGDVERLPLTIKKGELFDVCMVNEVFTHIKPSQRLRVLNNLTRVSSRIVISDRFAPVEREKTRVNARQFVSFKELANFLKKNGFFVEVYLVLNPRMPLEGKYFILFAWKSRKPGIKIIENAKIYA
jgi:hypothetical protein